MGRKEKSAGFYLFEGTSAQINFTSFSPHVERDLFPLVMIWRLAFGILRTGKLFTPLRGHQKKS